MEIGNITETYNNIKYAFEKEEGYEVEYIAECIEHGEEFISSFFAPKNYTPKQLKDIGYDMAIGWGGECIAVSRVIKHNNDGTMQVVRVP